jgi:ribosomal protein L37AE/L43A
MTGRADVDLATWFAEYELERCPECGKKTLVRGEGSFRVCLQCGVVETAVDASKREPKK